mmetsp:Transcript_67307/g.132762  ORF Transcript_67307/g.132762 Transcript_67307/m.132762 type:complete len:927 (+) Transcript_67307:39-2819(+)
MQPSSVVLVCLALHVLCLTQARRISIEEGYGLRSGATLPPEMDDPLVFKDGKLLFDDEFDDDQYEMYENMIAHKRAAAPATELTRLNQTTFDNKTTQLSRCVAIVQVSRDIGDKAFLCASYSRLTTVEKVALKLPTDDLCLPDSVRYASRLGRDWEFSVAHELWQVDRDAAAHVIAKESIASMCPLSVGPVAWPEQCVRAISWETRQGRKLSRVYEEFCADEKGITMAHKNLITVVGKLPQKPIFRACLQKVSDIIDLPKDAFESEVLPLAQKLVHKFCNVDQSEKVTPGCASVEDVHHRSCANFLLAKYSSLERVVSKTWGTQRNWCKQDGSDFGSGVEAGYIRFQDDLHMANKYMDLKEHALPKECTDDVSVFMQSALAAFKCACPRRHRQVPFSVADPLLLPCVGLEGESSMVKLKTGQKPVLELEARSVCNNNYPLFQITGDMGDMSKSMELITGPVPGTSEFLADMYRLYETVFNIIMKLSMKGVELLSDANAGLNRKTQGRHDVQPIAVLDAEFIGMWKNAIPDLWQSFSADGLQKHLDRKEDLLHWLVSKTVAVNGVGYPRPARDYPVLLAAQGQSNSRLKVDIQATFELPLDFGRNWMTVVQPFFLGTHYQDYAKRLVKSIHTVAMVLAEELVAQQPELLPLLAGATSKSEGILKSMLHFMAHFALAQASDDELLGDHNDQQIDVKVMSCAVSRKNDLYLNPRFGLNDLSEELDITLKNEGMHRLRPCLERALASISNRDEAWPQFSRKLAERLNVEGTTPELCVEQTDTTGCAEYLGLDRRPSSNVGPNKHYVVNPDRYFTRVLLAIQQTLDLASKGRKGRNHIRGCGHDIPPVFRQHGGRKFARFEDRGHGRIAVLLKPEVPPTKVTPKLQVPGQEQQAKWKSARSDLGNRHGFDPYNIVETTLVHPAMEAFADGS